MPSPSALQPFVPGQQVFGGRLFPEPLQYYQPMANFGSWATTAIGNGSVVIQPFQLMQPGVFSVADVYVSNTLSATNAASSQAHTLSMSVGLFSKNASTLSLVNSGSQTYAFTITGSSSSASYQGLKNLTVPVSFNLYEGDYWLAIASSTSSAGNAVAAAFSNVVVSFAGGLSAYSGVFGAATTASQQPILGYGAMSATQSAMPVSIAFSDIVGSANGHTCRPVVNLRNYSA